MMRFDIRTERWPLAATFVTARETMDALPLVLLTLHADGAVGRAEAAGVDYQGETPAGIAAEIERYLRTFNAPPSRQRVLAELPAGGARNAIDCALWDWEAKRIGQRAAAVAGLMPLRSLATVYTLSIAEPAAMAQAAHAAPRDAFLKLKLGGRDAFDVARVAAVRRARPAARLCVDVNEGWSYAELSEAAPHLHALGVEAIEQPLPAGADGELAAYQGPIPICADESFRDVFDPAGLAGYAMINVKLDKCGGLTAALALAAAARRGGFGLMVGSMLGPSLGMAPAVLIGRLSDIVDLDGPLLLARDRADAMTYAGTTVAPPDPALWG